jgi:hypothetical protein
MLLTEHVNMFASKSFLLYDEGARSLELNISSFAGTALVDDDWQENRHCTLALLK